MSPEQRPTIEIPERLAQLGVTAEQIEAFCRRWKIRELAVFGSVLRDDFRDDSDVDLLVTYEESTRWGAFKLVDMRDDACGLFGREVDLVERRLIARSKNFIRRREILRNARRVYAA